MACAPARKARKLSMPIEAATGKPMADHTEYLPPTQSHIWNIRSGGIPSFIASAGFAVTATKCSETSRQPLSRSHCCARRALAIVSCVAKDLEDTMNKVVSGLD